MTQQTRCICSPLALAASQTQTDGRVRCAGSASGTSAHAVQRRQKHDSVAPAVTCPSAVASHTTSIHASFFFFARYFLPQHKSSPWLFSISKKVTLCFCLHVLNCRLGRGSTESLPSLSVCVRPGRLATDPFSYRRRAASPAISCTGLVDCKTVSRRRCKHFHDPLRSMFSNHEDQILSNSW